MSLYYVSESGIISSNFLMGGSWSPDPQLGNYSTAVDTRSLSISLFTTAKNSTDFNNLFEESTTNEALLFYESPNGKVLALLYRVMNVVSTPGGESQIDQWIDITNQDSKALPNEFRNAPGFNYSNSLILLSNNNTTFSKTLYEADPIAVYSTPFSSGLDSSGSVNAIFCSPLGLPLNATSPPSGERFIAASYTIGLNGTGNFSVGGIQHATLYTEFIS